MSKQHNTYYRYINYEKTINVTSNPAVHKYPRHSHMLCELYTCIRACSRSIRAHIHPPAAKQIHTAPLQRKFC